MINKIIEMLEREERVALDFVDRHAFLNQDHENECDREAVAAIAKSSLVVKSILGGGAALALEDDRYCIPEKDYKYFKIKEPTFNDLIDVAVQAVKDGVIAVWIITSGALKFSPADALNNTSTYYDDEFISDGIWHIKSLYTETFVETFVIEGHGFPELKVGGVFTQNGREIILDADHIEAIMNTPLFLLKGATVTQEVSK